MALDDSHLQLLITSWYHNKTEDTLPVILGKNNITITDIGNALLIVSQIQQDNEIRANSLWLKEKLTDTINVDAFINNFEKKSFREAILRIKLLSDSDKNDILQLCNYSSSFNHTINENDNIKVSIYYQNKNHTECDKDIYLNMLMPINGGIQHFQYDNYLPLHQWISRYYSDISIQMTSDYSKLGERYLYVVSFKFLSRFIRIEEWANFENYIPKEVLKDCQNGTCQIIINDSYEYADFKPLFKSIYSQLNSLKILDNTWIITGNKFSLKGNFLYRFMHRRFLNLGKRIFKVRYFEDAVAELKKHFYNDYTFEYRLNKILSNDDIKHFICFNRLEKDFRTVIAYYIHKHELSPKFHISHPSISEPISLSKYRSLIDKNTFKNFKHSLPWTLDLEVQKALWNIIPTELLQDSFVYLITETYYNKIMGKDFNSFTEKTYKPIAFFMPFIVVGPAYSLKYLKQDGYQTFSKWWDESYDEEKNHTERILKIIEVVREISSWENEKLKQVIKEMTPILKHNYNILMNSKRNTEVINFFLNTTNKKAPASC